MIADRLAACVRSFARIATLTLAALMSATPALAHKASDSYLTIARNGTDGADIAGRWDIALRDLDVAITLDTNGDGDITWGEVKRQQAAIAQYALSRLALTSGGVRCPLEVTRQMIDTHSDGTYAVLELAGRCPQPAPTLAVDYRLLFDVDPQHRGLLRFDDEKASRSLILSVDAPSQTLGRGSWTEQFEQYVHDGVWHIWLGFDHILFLVSLLLPAVLVRRGGRWTATDGFRPAFMDVVKIVTAFTVAHSITLSLATLGVISPNARWVDAGVALSVVLAALNNVFPVVGHGRWVAAFGFGLIHGMGFASALKDLGLPTGSLVLSLFGFNVGVELGQLAVVVLFLPLAFGLRETWTYRHVVMAGGSTAIAAIAGVWLVERAFNVTVPVLALAG